MKFVCILTLIVFNLSFTAKANDGKTIKLTRTISQLVTDKNKQVMTLSENGSLSITFPQGSTLFKKPIQSTLANKNRTIEEAFDLINTSWTSSGIKNSVNNAKSNKQNSLFYSSDPDFFELSLQEDGIELWKISFNNRDEIKHLAPNNQNLFQLNQLLNSLNEIAGNATIQAIKELKK